jgi:hypothetical protein
MPKKNFKGNTGHLDKFFTEEPATVRETQVPQKTPAAPKTQRTHKTQVPPKTQTPPKAAAPAYYRLNLKLKAEFKDYLEQIHWETRQSITQYINTLIETDMAKRTQGTHKTRGTH